MNGHLTQRMSRASGMVGHGPPAAGDDSINGIDE